MLHGVVVLFENDGITQDRPKCRQLSVVRRFRVSGHFLNVGVQSLFILPGL